MGLVDRLLRRSDAWDGIEKRYSYGELLAQQAQAYSFNGNSYILPVETTWATKKAEPIGNDFTAYVQAAYKGNGIVFAAIEARRLLFSEARFRFKDRTTGKLFGTPDLLPLEFPGVNQTTGELLSRMEQDVSLSGNWYGVRQGKFIKRLRPDWVTIMIGSHRDSDAPGWMRDAVVVGYLYEPGGKASDDAEVLLPHEVAHWSPIPDPENAFRGMSWLTPILNEIVADTSATTQKQAYFDHAATPNMAIVMSDDVRTPEQFRQAREAFEESHAGANKAFKTLYLANGADVKPVGSNLRDMDFSSVQAGGEARIAVASRVPAAILGIKEGLAGSSLNAGNLGVARRLLADGWARPSWRSACAALAPLVNVPANSDLWYDDDIPFLREDATDAANITSINATAIRTLTDGGFEPQSVVAAVVGGDLGQLVHTGLLSVQMQPPGTEAAPAAPSVPRSAEFREAGEYQVQITVPPPTINVEAPVVNVEPSVPVVHVDAPQVRMDAPVVNVDAPVVNVPAPVVHVPAPVVNVEQSEPRLRMKHVVRDEDGLIVRVVEETVDE